MTTPAKEPLLSYNLLKSIVSSAKTNFTMAAPSDSFSIASKSERPYIHPQLKKIEYEHEKPRIMLISAVGAAGKSALAKALSFETQLPLMNLANHKPVGDNTLTGLLTQVYDVGDLSNILRAIGDGKYGVIIDGIDEGRSKTTEKGFEAFLDDIVRLSGKGSGTSFVLLGRTQVLEDCWLYLTGKNVAADLISIAPFSLGDAKKYIDAFAPGSAGSFKEKYGEARDYVLENLKRAFGGKTGEDGTEFLSFIGYAPVLESIVTLLTEEPNYQKLTEQLKSAVGSEVEVSLLCRIGSYILDRERNQKVIPNILNPLIAELPEAEQADIKKRVFSIEEQCMRLVSFCLQQPLKLETISEPAINEKYEGQLVEWLAEHPFVSGHQFRNAVFESMCQAILIAWKNSKCVDLISNYATSHKYSYYLIYFLENLAKDSFVPIEHLSVIVGSALEFRSTTSGIVVSIDGVGEEEVLESKKSKDTIDIEIEITFNSESSKTFSFKSGLNGVDSIQIGSRLASTYIEVPCDVVIGGGAETDFTAPVEVIARTINLTSQTLVLKQAHNAEAKDKLVILEAARLISNLEHITTNGLDFRIVLDENRSVAYPAFQFCKKSVDFPSDPNLKEKYIRLRRILMQFRSHSKGSLARFKEKIEHARVIQNETGQMILDRLLQDGILQLKGKFYHLKPDAVNAFLGISWLDLRKGETNDKLIGYLRAIK